MSTLAELVARTRARLEVARLTQPLERLLATESTPGVRRPFGAALARPGRANVIAEFKRRSPSRGVIRTDLHPVNVAQSYEVGGAAALSVLTEEEFFGGSLSDLQQARAATLLPTLRKDFIVDAYQIWEASLAGADAVLLIVAALERRQLIDFFALAGELSLDVLFEAHHERELDTVLEWTPEARLIGINNRDLKTFSTDLGVTLRLVKRVPSDKLVVSESGIQKRDDVLRLNEAGVHAMLVGESLIRAEDIGAKIRELLGTKPEQ